MIKVGSRDSRLAVVQAEEVMRRLGECELVTMKTTGDKILDRTLDKVGGKGLFVKELDRALAAGEVDLTVHSLKDVPMEQPVCRLSRSRSGRTRETRSCCRRTAAGTGKSRSAARLRGGACSLHGCFPVSR